MERQEGITLSEIRKDHLVRYNLAKQIIIKKLRNTNYHLIEIKILDDSTREINLKFYNN